jgi:Flp pilus assembly protein TadD
MPESAKKSLVILVYLALALSTIAVYWQVRNFGFINYDDNFYVYENPHVLNGFSTSNLFWAFTTNISAHWHPLTWLSLMLDCQLFGPGPSGFHLVNLFLHIINTLLLFAVLKKMTGSLWPSAFVAAAFALHPMHVESVAWIAERKDVLSTFFWLLTLAAWLRCLQRPSVFRYSAALAAFALGLMAKSMLITLPFVLLLLDYWPLERKISSHLLFEKIPFFALSIISSVITFLVMKSGGLVININQVSLNNRIANVFLSYVRYIGKMFWPQNLAVFYPFDANLFPLWKISLCALFLFAISAFVLRLRKNYGCLLTGWFWFIGTLIPVIGLIQVGSQSYADRYTYIPYIGLFIMIAWSVPQLLAKSPHRKIVLAVTMLTALITLGIYAYKQTTFWNNSSTLFSHALEVTNDNYVAHSCLGQELYRQGKFAPAIEHLNKALQIRPNYIYPIISLGCIETDRGDLKQAIDYFQKALNLKSDSADAHTNLATALQKCGRFNDAIVHIRRSLQIEPDNPATMNNLAWLFATCSDPNYRSPAEAIHLAQQACRATAYVNPEMLDTLAAAFASAGRFNEAIITAQKALNLANENNKQIFQAIKDHLDLYKASRPLIEIPKTQNSF